MASEPMTPERLREDAERMRGLARLREPLVDEAATYRRAAVVFEALAKMMEMTRTAENPRWFVTSFGELCHIYTDLMDDADHPDPLAALAALVTPSTEDTSDV